MSMDWYNMTGTDALRHAKMISRLTLEEISELSGIPMASLKRMFNETDLYFPSLINIPSLCRVMGNDVLVQWIQAKIQGVVPQPAPTANGLLRAAAIMSKELGEAAGAIVCATEDQKLTKSELKDITGEVSGRYAGV